MIQSKICNDLYMFLEQIIIAEENELDQIIKINQF